MNKDELARQISFENKVSIKKSKEILDTILDVIEETVKSGGSVSLRNFGVFKTKTLAPRTYKNLNTTEEYYVPERTVPVFRPGKGFKSF